MTYRYFVSDVRVPNEVFHPTHDIAHAIFRRTDMLLADISLRPYLVVMERMPDGTTREVKPSPWIQELLKGRA